MADIRDLFQFIRGRWDWRRLGYEQGLPRGSGFGDIDAHLELNGHSLIIESKAWDGLGDPRELSWGQMHALHTLARNGTTVWILYGCAGCNNPLYVRLLHRGAEHGFADWREVSIVERREALHALILSWAEWAEKTPS